jgi:hypothetical protein
MLVCAQYVLVSSVGGVLYMTQSRMLLHWRSKSPLNSAPELVATMPVTQEYPGLLYAKSQYDACGGRTRGVMHRRIHLGLPSEYTAWVIQSSRRAPSRDLTRTETGGVSWVCYTEGLRLGERRAGIARN